MELGGLVPLAGGWSGQTFEASYGGERVVVRVLPPGGPRGVAAAEIDAAVLELVRGLLPVPRVLEVRRGDLAADVPGVLVTSFEPGTRGDLVLPGLDADGLRRAGESVGRVAAALGGMPMPAAGSFLDRSLRLGPLGGEEGLAAWTAEHARRWPDWSAPEVDGLVAVADLAEGLLDTVARRCLVHGDLDPKNLLLDPVTLEVTAVLDWEFAHAGHPSTDLGNLLRFERHPAYVAGVLSAWTDRHGGSPDDVRRLARCADLWALVDLTDRVGTNPVADRAARLLRLVARTGDVEAWDEQLS